MYIFMKNILFVKYIFYINNKYIYCMCVYLYIHN